MLDSFYGWVGGWVGGWVEVRTALFLHFGEVSLLLLLLCVQCLLDAAGFFPGHALAVDGEVEAEANRNDESTEDCMGGCVRGWDERG